MSINENLLKEISEIQFKERKALVILTTQRSGSTMLCDDIKNLGVLGTPNEHFFDILYQLKGKTGEELVDHFTSNGNLYNSEFYSIKLMYNYLPEFGYWVSNRNKPYGSSINEEIYREFSIRFFLEKFEDITFIYLKRKNKFEQAVSHYRAIKTNIWHKRTYVDHKREDTWFEKIISNKRGTDEERYLLNNIDVGHFDRLYDRACNEDRELELLIKKLGIDCLSLVYEEIMDDYPNYLLSISAKAGIETNIDSLSKRQNQKIVSNNFVLKFKKSLGKKTNRVYI